MYNPISAAELRAALEIRDLTDPSQGSHALQLVVERIQKALTGETWIRRDHPVVSLADNYDNLGYAASAVTRDARYTRYVDETHVLRSHTSAMVPPALREIQTEDDVLLVCPGLCYRRDSVDWQHTGTPHQLDLWRITRDRQCTEADLERMIDAVTTAALPGLEWRAVPTLHPYTTHGRQIDVHWRGAWIEIGECGLAAPLVLRRAGLDRAWTGLAMGLGLDRVLMLRKGIPDIRLLRSTDPRVAEQMLDLEPYRPVSAMPPVRRDLSIVTSNRTDLSPEALGDRVREVLGTEDAETVEVCSITAYDELPEPARVRLGIRPDQVNVLIRLVLRPLDRTLTDAEANELRDRVYTTLHQGPVAELTG